MSYSRTLIQDFSTANKLYVNAIVTFYKVLNGEKTAELATLYSGITGENKIANPQMLDSFGKVRAPVYIQEPVIMTVTGLGNTPDHDTGVVGVPSIVNGNGSPEGVVAAPVGTLFLRLDGGVGSTLYVKETGVGNTGWSAK